MITNRSGIKATARPRALSSIVRRFHRQQRVHGSAPVGLSRVTRQSGSRHRPPSPLDAACSEVGCRPLFRLSVCSRPKVFIL